MKGANDDLVAAGLLHYLAPNLVEKKYRVDRHPFPIAGAKKSSNHSPVGSAKAIDNRGQL